MNRNDAKKPRMFLFRSFIKTFLGIHHTLTLSICPFYVFRLSWKTTSHPDAGTSISQNLPSLPLARSWWFTNQPHRKKKLLFSRDVFCFANSNWSNIRILLHNRIILPEVLQCQPNPWASLTVRWDSSHIAGSGPRHPGELRAFWWLRHATETLSLGIELRGQSLELRMREASQNKWLSFI